MVAYLTQIGRYDEALESANIWIQKNPNHGFAYGFKAQVLFFLNRKDEALDLLKRNDELFNDDINYLREGAKCYYFMGEYKSSKSLVNKLTTMLSDHPPIVLWLNATIEEMNGNLEEAQRFLSNLKKKYEEEASGSPAWFIALYYAAINDYESTFKWLQKSYDRHEVEMIWLREEPLLIPLRSDKRYKRLYKKVGFTMKPHS